MKSNRYDANGVRKPNVTIGLIERERLDGGRFLLGTIAEELVIEPGSTIRLQRIARDASYAESFNGASFALVIHPPVTGWEATKKNLQEAVRLDGIGSLRMPEQGSENPIENEPVDQGQHHTGLTKVDTLQGDLNR